MKVKEIKAIFDSAKVQNNSLIIMMGCAVWQVKGKQLVLVVRRNQYQGTKEEAELLKLFQKMGFSIKEDRYIRTDSVNKVIESVGCFSDNSIPSVVVLDRSMFTGNPQAAMLFQKPAA